LQISLLTQPLRLSAVLLRSGSFCNRYDISSCAQVWEEEPSCLLVDLLYCRRSFCHVRQSFRNFCEIDYGRKEPIYTPIDLRVHHLDHSLHLDADELSQQGFEPISHIYVSDFECQRGLHSANFGTESIQYTMLHLPPQHFARPSSSTVVLTLQMLLTLYLC
jgi:hypothetical protein